MCPDSCLSRSDAAEDKEPVGQQEPETAVEQQQQQSQETKTEEEGGDNGQKEDGETQYDNGKE